MSNALHIDGKTLYPIKEATAVVSYSRDYVTRLAREQKVFATYVGRQWFVDVDSLKAYEEQSATEQELRKKQLSKQRKEEQRVHQAAEKLRGEQQQRERTLRMRAAITASLVLSFGLLSGFLTHQYFLLSSDTQVAAAAQPSVSGSDAVARPARAAAKPATSDQTPVMVERSVESLGEVRNGVVLYPAASTTAPTELFSDEVIMEELPDGTKVIYQTDETGAAVGDPIPFVEVPLTAEQR